jgi:hypothetical protein
MSLGILGTRLGRVTRVAVLSLVLLAVLCATAGADGERRWVKRYNGPGNGVDAGAAVAFDKWGNVYAGGKSVGGASQEDYLLIKYAPDGSVKWTARYKGPGNGYDGIKGLAVDNNGNVYVTGRSFGSGTGADYATVKYDSSGNEKWVRRYSGPGAAEDGAVGIALDSSGNVIVTGYSTGKSSGYDIVTIKYGADGSTKWVRRYDGPAGQGDMARGVVVDSDNNVYVTGPSRGSGTDWDFCTIKYGEGGAQQWVSRWSGPGDSVDGSTDIALDGYGLVYVTGYSYRSRNDCDYVTIKYGPKGGVRWVRRYDGPAGGPDVAWAIAVDGNGVYVTGQSQGKGTSADFATIRYNRKGDQTWVRRYSTGGAVYDVANAIVAGNGRVYVTGFCGGVDGRGDYMTIAYGEWSWHKWSDRYDGPGDDFDQGNAIGISQATGNVYVTGGSAGSGTGPDFATIKYAP